VLAEVAEERAETRSNRPAGERDEEEQAEQKSPKATPYRRVAAGIVDRRPDAARLVVSPSVSAPTGGGITLMG